MVGIILIIIGGFLGLGTIIGVIDMITTGSSPSDAGTYAGTLIARFVPLFLGILLIGSSKKKTTTKDD
ncbi:MAG: hypothetical protein FWG08_03585 [Propionibacteriaceae bacterium]|nr:hypothetical protein [Propionibacteriaceae bacterium]